MDDTQFPDEIPAHRRELMLKIWAGYMPFHDVTLKLYYLDMHFPEEKIDQALKWLVKNKITGRAFVEWTKYDCANSNLEMVRNLTARVEGEKELRRLFVGKDMRV